MLWAAGFVAVAGGASIASAAALVEFDAAAAGAGVTPTGVTPAWGLQSAGMVNNGTALQQNNAAGEYGRYISPAVSGLMSPTATYGIEVRMRPLSDVNEFLYGSDYANISILWQDNGGGTTNGYSLTFDLDQDEAGPGTLGTLRYGTGSYSDVGDVAAAGSELATGINWSQLRTIYIGYRPAPGLAGDGAFDVYLDGTLMATLQRGWMWRNLGGNFTVDGVYFGDNTTNSRASSAEWARIALYDTATPPPVPEPAAVTSFAAFGLACLVRRRRR